MRKKSSHFVSAANTSFHSDIAVQKALIDNFVSMQKVLTNLTVKFDSLSDNISKLLQLFEISAKTYIKKTEEGVPGEKDLLRKLDVLLDQNKTVAKGITLIEEKIRHKVYDGQEQQEDENIMAHNSSKAHDHTNNFNPHLEDRPRPKPLPRI